MMDVLLAYGQWAARVLGPGVAQAHTTCDAQREIELGGAAAVSESATNTPDIREWMSFVSQNDYVNNNIFFMYIFLALDV